jgi:hypothetical protein
VPVAAVPETRDARKQETAVRSEHFVVMLGRIVVESLYHFHVRIFVVQELRAGRVDDARPQNALSRHAASFLPVNS